MADTGDAGSSACNSTADSQQAKQWRQSRTTKQQSKRSTQAPVAAIRTAVDHRALVRVCFECRVATAATGSCTSAIFRGPRRLCAVNRDHSHHLLASPCRLQRVISIGPYRCCCPDAVDNDTAATSTAATTAGRAHGHFPLMSIMMMILVSPYWH